MKSEKIYRLAIFFVEHIKDKLIAKLHELGIVEIKEAVINTRFDPSHDLSLLSNLDYELQTIKPGNKILDSIDYNYVLQKAKRLRELYKNAKLLNDEKKRLLDNIQDSELVMSYINYDKLPEGYKLIAFQIDEKDLKDKKNWEVYRLPDNKLIVFILTETGQKVELPDKAEILYVPNSKEELMQMRNRIKEINKEIISINDEIEKIESDEYLQDVKFSIMVYLERENVAKLIGKGEGYGLIECYIPEKNLSLLDEIKREFNDDIYIIYEKLEDSPVVYINNPDYVKPIEPVSYSFGGIPNYKDIDPSLLYYLLFPIMFGFIVGDVIYGIIIMILAKYVESRFKQGIFNGMAKLWFMGGVWSIIFGIIFNEFAGFELLGFTLFHRGDHVIEYLGFSLIIGYIHLTLAYILNIKKHIKHLDHVLPSIAWLILLNVLALYLLGIFSEWFYIVIIIAILILYKEEGILGIIELPSILSNLISYVRLAILGIVGVILASLINRLFLPDLFSLIFFIVFHLLHILLVILEGSIQAGRLNIVEFRSKFFEGGGRFLNVFSINKVKGEQRWQNRQLD